MARLASDTKKGFYPTEVKTIQKVIDKTIQFPDQKVTALDCCAGEGEAIDFIGNTYNCETYAVELDRVRAKSIIARGVHKVLNADALGGVRKSNHWVALNFLNPPYGEDVMGDRYELKFIEKWGLTTAVGGVLILVINPSTADEKMASALRLQGYKPIGSFFDPSNEDYQKYGQFFIVLQKGVYNLRVPTPEFLECFENKQDINLVGDLKKVTIKTGARPLLFKEIDTPRWKIEQYLKKSKLKKNFFDELKHSNMMNASIEHPNEGQAAILIASGALNKEVTLQNGERIILKGTSVEIKSPVANQDENG